MARGWESKSVEAQIELSEADDGSSEKRRMSADQIETARKKNGLLLARARVVQELGTCQRDRYRDILNRALADLDAQLTQFE
jgi:hypothetical protein